jgi:tRNA uridine 5-carbamoylmethylation protein Kti12
VAQGDSSDAINSVQGLPTELHLVYVLCMYASVLLQGYRYELWCAARAAGTRYCMVHVATATGTCREWNSKRPEGERYSDVV